MQSPFAYSIHIPPAIAPDQRYPVIFALHGIGYSEQDILSVVADLEEEFILIAVRGHLSYNQGYAYYTLKEYGKPDRDTFDESLEMLQVFMEYATNKYPVSADNRYLLGFSQGAILSMSLALLLGNSIKGIVAMNGYIPAFVKDEFEVKSIDRLSIFLSDGEFDDIFPVSIGKENYVYLNSRAKSVCYKTYPAGHEICEENGRDIVAWLRNDSAHLQQRSKSIYG